jgi:hypothetical protein
VSRIVEISSKRNRKTIKSLEKASISANPGKLFQEEKFSFNNENPVDFSSLSTDEIQARLKTIGVKTKLRNRKKLLGLTNFTYPAIQIILI